MTKENAIKLFQDQRVRVGYKLLPTENGII